MRAVRWHGRNDVRVEDVEPPPPPGAGDVTVRISWCGICGTDLEELREGPLFIPVDAPHPISGRVAPLTMGHEFTGVVHSVGAGVDHVRPGDRVAVDPNVFCGVCSWCRLGEVVRCDDMGTLGLQGDGGLAELCTVPARACFRIPNGVPDDAAALTEPLSVAVRALRRARMKPGDTVVVIGGGTVGLMTLQAAIAVGAASVSVVERLADRRRLAEELGAASTHPDHAEAPADVAVESAGNVGAVEAAIGSLRKGGRAVLMGIHPARARFLPLDMIRNETEILGSFSHVYDQDFRIALELLGQGTVRTLPLVTDRIPIEQAVEDGLLALEREPDRHLKILVRPDGLTPPPPPAASDAP